MKQIRMVDLISQYNAIKPEVDAAMQQVVNDAAFINGPEVKAFQAELESYLRVKHVIPCANGTDALQIAMMALDLQPGDEVITATFTYVATAEVIALLKLTPVLVDVDPNTFLIDPTAIEKAITPRTKAIVPVHLFGQCADMHRIMEIAKANNLFVIEDTAQAIGSKFYEPGHADGPWQKAGTIGDIGATSFFPSKNLGCFGDGGALFTNNDQLADRMRRIANHGQSKQYYHDDIGVNSRLDSLQAAVLRIKLRRLKDYNQSRRIAAAAYDAAFGGHPNLEIPQRTPWSSHVFHQYTLKVIGKDRNALRDFLASKDIPAMIYYPVALHMQTAYKDDRYSKGAFPVTEELVDQVISLPMHTELDHEQLEYIIKHVLEFLNQ
ncbi:MAG: DegT/DnrJ/EryC1/StrS family aminotransferase [Schleiferiaceae bacterium]|nr:DegT/DnrJ/EryC1/StrS family aminotransferase [Schleiferiaceae bacterium]